ncbi:MAG: hypothetical protein HN522_02540 [Flavobacteriales bacterium]|nr:hypothetical protein [Flavobacteriales bacterium]MBT5089825.1 hypothetical protein [Flavobacteriales bacterium]MBT5750500.1 hypothetical protein [Flavobacteriales bacterium]
MHFLYEHHLLTLATSQNNKPYCCNLFYVYDQVSNQLIFSTETKTKHAQDFIVNTNVAGSVALETKHVSKIQGVQLLGTIEELKGERLKIAKEQYIKAFSYAANMDLHLWAMPLNFIKMTHNKLGFGKKLIWEK